MGGRGVPGFVDRCRARVCIVVGDVDRRAGLDHGHRVDEVLPREVRAAGVMGVRERHRADLVDIRRRVATRDPSDLVAARWAVEIWIVCDLCEVEVEDVDAVVLGRRSEPNVAAHPARPGECRVESIDRHVGRADEVDLVAGRPGHGHAERDGSLAQREPPHRDRRVDQEDCETDIEQVPVRRPRGQRVHERRAAGEPHQGVEQKERRGEREDRSKGAAPVLADPARHDVDRVQDRVDLAREPAAEERRVVDAVHGYEQLVERETAAHAAHSREHALVHDPGGLGEPARIRRTGLFGPLAEHVLAPCLVLADQIATRIDRSPRPVELRHELLVRHPTPAGRTAKRLTAHPNRVDLVDEDDALAAPLAGQLLRLAREEAHDDRIDADEGLREARARDRDERRVEPGRDRLRHHRLAGAGRSVEEQPAFALAAGALEHLA